MSTTDLAHVASDVALFLDGRPTPARPVDDAFPSRVVPGAVRTVTPAGKLNARRTALARGGP
jgi:hypothetical protein